MIEKNWFLIGEIIPGHGVPAWQFLGFSSPETCRQWIRKGKAEGWLKPGREFKKRYPTRQKSAIQLHVTRCLNLGASK